MTRIAEPGRNCWRVATAARFGALIDAEEYFAAVASACEKAEESILIVGWAVDSRVRLRPTRPHGGLPDELGPFLAALVRRRRSLRVRVLAWDMATVFGIESGFFPVFRTAEERRRRFEWELDSEHALGAATHQKVIVVDDRVAFLSGMDVTGQRWDTRAHAPGDPNRVHAGKPYRPYHDVGIVVDGEAAAVLGALMNTRWARATGRGAPLARVRASFPVLQPGTPLGGVLDRAGEISQRATDAARTLGQRATGLGRRATQHALATWHRGRPAAAPAPPGDRWPDGVAPRAANVPVAFARTEAAYLWHPGVREIEALWVEDIAAARRCIYIENQYFTSRTITDALAKRLAEPGGPEVIIVQPLTCSGWLEHATMGRLREEHLKTLREADAGGRLRVLHPVAADGEAIYLHSKVLVVDDAVARVGTANAANRSMTLDTEIDAHVEAEGRADLGELAAWLRDALVAEHLGVPIERLRDEIGARGSLGEAIDALRSQGQGKTLHELPLEGPKGLAALLPASLMDPEDPVTAEELSNEHVPRREKPTRFEAARTAGVVLILAALTIGWALVPLGSSDGAATLAQHLSPHADNPLAPFVALALFLVAGAIAFPMSVMVVATELVFGPIVGSLLSITGAFGSAILGYVQGRVLGRRWLRRLGGHGLNRVSRALARHGVLTIAAARLMPFMPWTLTSLAAGASHVRPLDYLLGTLLGLVPGVAAAALLTDASAQAAGPRGAVELAVFAVLLGAGFAWIHAHLRRTSGG